MRCYLCKREVEEAMRVFVPTRNRREKDNFRDLCQDCYDHIREARKERSGGQRETKGGEKMKWSEIAEEDQEALVEWYNIREEDLDAKDRARLARLFTKGKFAHWSCPACDEKVLVGRPDDWDHFQGVCQSEPLGELCTECSGRYLFLKTFAEE